MTGNQLYTILDDLEALVFFALVILAWMVWLHHKRCREQMAVDQQTRLYDRTGLCRCEKCQSHQPTE